jgi:hypothetical protein
MNESDIRRLIRNEIRREMDVILPGLSSGNDHFSEAILDLYPGMPEIAPRPVMHPAGFVSRAVNGTIQVNGRNGEHSGNRMVLGHRDKLRPGDINQGEMAIYSSDGTTVLKTVYVRRDKIQVGSKASTEQMVLGTTYVTETLTNHLLYLIELVTDLIAQRQTDAIHIHFDLFGLPTQPPSNASLMQQEKALLEELKAAVQQLKADDVDSKRIISDIAFTEKGTP